MNYYKRLNKEEKKDIKKAFLKSEDSTIYKKANRIIILAYLGVIVGCISTIFDYLYKNGIINYILDALLFIFSIIFLIKMKKTQSDELNKYALKNKKKSNNK